MRTILPILIVLLVITSCNNNNDNQTETTSIDSIQTSRPVIVSDSSLQGCYSLISGRDTASLELNVDKTNVSGSLSYNLFEKDRNDGSFRGEINGDLLKVWYLFRSEGMMSVRQEIWKVASGKLIPATGEVIVRSDTAVFTDPAKLSFDTSRAFLKVKCII